MKTNRETVTVRDILKPPYSCSVGLLMQILVSKFSPSQEEASVPADTASEQQSVITLLNAQR